MARRKTTLIPAILALLLCGPSFAAEEGGKHLPHNHIALIAGVAMEEQDDGHRENGRVLGVDYVRQPWEQWAWGVSFEMEAFGNKNKRHGVLAVPVFYYPTHSWKVFGAPGIEFREKGDPDKAMFRVGTAYDFHLGEHWTLSPVGQIDFIAGGTTVYVLSLALGYGF